MTNEADDERIDPAVLEALLTIWHDNVLAMRATIAETVAVCERRLAETAALREAHAANMRRWAAARGEAVAP